MERGRKKRRENTIERERETHTNAVMRKRAKEWCEEIEEYVTENVHRWWNEGREGRSWNGGRWRRQSRKSTAEEIKVLVGASFFFSERRHSSEIVHILRQKTSQVRTDIRCKPPLHTRVFELLCW